MVKPPPAEAGGRPSRRLDGGDEAKLLQRFHAIVEPDLFDDLSALETQYRRSSEVHLATCRHRQRPNEEIARRGTGMCAAAFPATNDVVAFGDQIRGAPEVEIGEGLAEIGHEGFDVITAASWLVQQVVEQHIRGSDLVDDGEVAGLSPEACEPATNNGLVVLFDGHDAFLVFELMVEWKERGSSLPSD